MDGRDIGTVVLPDAQLKVFLDANLDERARRRAAEHPGVPFEAIRRDLAARDAQDSGRATAPLRRADDAVIVDSTDMDIDAVVRTVVELARARVDG
jgi:cytidylate kinase